MSLCHPPPTCTQSYPLSGLGERESWNTTGESGADDKGVLIGRRIQQRRQGREDKSTERWVRERRRGLERERILEVLLEEIADYRRVQKETKAIERGTERQRE